MVSHACGVGEEVPQEIVRLDDIFKNQILILRLLRCKN